MIITASSFDCPLYFSTLHILFLIPISALQGRDYPHFTNEDEAQRGNQLAEDHKSSHTVQLFESRSISDQWVYLVFSVCGDVILIL